ncbi:MAG: amidohydrolase [Chloroflexia bacterium]|nr:amidohydrolase [Chloroflexia bacterium]
MPATPSSAELIQALERAEPTIAHLATEVWNLAELSLHEVASAQLYQQALQAAGFTLVSVGTAGIPTAFIAEWTYGSGGPIIGFLLEYDALPDLGNAPVPRQQPRDDGKTSGHGCGHNLLGAGLAGAAIAVKHLMETKAIPGTLRLYGCAAEETEGAKVYMARAGLFNDLDACLHWHPAPFAVVANQRTAANNSLKIEFFGRSAHAGMEPWHGRSALHAMELAAHGLNLMREHLEPTARLHYIFEAAGTAPNVVPAYTRLWLKVRDSDRAHVAATTAWIEQIAAGAALATQTEARIKRYYGVHDLLPNTPLAERMQAHLAQVGVPQWNDEEQAFARACQHACGLPEHGLASQILPLQAERTIGGSSDVAEVSWLAPTMGLTMPTMPLHVALHTWPVTACGGTSIGLKGAVAAAHVLALMTLDLLTDAQLRTAVRADFDYRTTGFTYVSPLPPEQLHPVDLPEWFRNDGVSDAQGNGARLAEP